MNAEGLLKVYEKISEAPDAVARLRRFVLDLAVRGKLVEQDAGDEPASELFARMKAERLALERAKKIKKVKLGPLIETATTIPKNWAWTQLGNVGDWGSGSTPQRGNPDFYGGGITWLKSGELGDSLALHGSEETVTELALSKCSFRLNKPGDVLIAMYGATIGKLAILAEKAVTNQAVCGCTPFAGLSNRYLYLFLLANRAAFHGSSEGGAQPNISKVKIVNTTFPLPPTNEQHRIVAKVDELMGLCDRLEAARVVREEVRDKLTAASLARLTAPDAGSTDTPDQTTEASQVTGNTPAAIAFHTHARFALETLPALTSRPDQIKTLRQTILNLAVRGKLVEQDPADEPTSKLLTRMVNERKETVARRKIRGATPPKAPSAQTEGFMLPSSWDLCALGQITLITDPNPSHRYPDYSGGTVPILSTREFAGDGGWNPETAKLTTQAFWEFQKEICDFAEGDIIFARKGRLGLPRFLPRIEKFTFSHTLFSIKPMTGLDPNYLLWLLRRDEVVAWLTNEMNQNTGVPTLGKAKTERLPIPLPPLAEQYRIVAKVDALMALCDRLEAALTTADTTRTRLLNALLHEALTPATPIPEAAE